MANMKHVTITVPPELDEAIAKEAKRRGMSKSELYRESAAKELPGGKPEGENLWYELAGFVDTGDDSVETDYASNITEALYGESS